jgi:DNA polymerase I-like protein with 3'-5' exonuclease and polymerase domains
MALFDTYSRSSKEIDKALKEKLAKKAKPKTGKADNLLNRINTIRQRIQENLGEYREDYRILITDEEIKEYFDHIIENDLCSIDTETTGLNFFQDDIVGICIYTEGEKASYIPLNHISSIYQTRISGQADIDLVKNELKRCKEKNTKFIYHNGKFDLNVLETFLGFKMNCPYWDTLVASYLITNDKNQRSLKDQYSKYCSHLEDKEKIDTLSHFNDLFDGLRFDYVPIDSGYIYAARDAWMTYKLFEHQKAFFEQPGNEQLYKLFSEVEVPLIQVTADMQRTGVAIDMDLAAKLKNEFGAKLNTITDTVLHEIDNYQDAIIKYRMTHYNTKLQDPINFNSNDQLAILLYDIIGCSNPDKEKPRGVDEKALKHINIPLTNAILEYRSVNKLLSTYIDAIPAKVEKTTGRLHASFNQNGADTGRFSSSEPNLQNIPRDGGIRCMFKATDGYYMVGADYSQQEPRVLAHLCQDENMINAYKTGRDLYSTMASLAFHVPYEDCKEFYPDGTVNKEGKKRRSHIKGVVLGLMYGRGDASVGEQLGITVEEARDLSKSLFEAFPKMKQYIEDTKAAVKKIGHTTTLWGRRRYLEHITKDKFEFKYGVNRPVNFDPMLDSDDDGTNDVSKDIKDYYNNLLEKANFGRRRQIIADAEREGILIEDNSGWIAESERQVVNSIVQGSAADMTKKALVALYNHKELKELGFRLLMSVHDENIGECPKENVKRVTELLSEVMIAANDKCCVPMKCDSEVSEFWYGPTIDLKEVN